MNVLILCGTIVVGKSRIVTSLGGETTPCLSLKLNRRHYGLLRTNEKNDDENQPFYLLFIGKRVVGKRGASRSGDDNDKDW